MDPGHWRDQQLGAFKQLGGTEVVLQQEQLMLDFVTSISGTVWRWHAPNSKFRDLCAKKICLSESNYNGLIFFGMPSCDSKTLIETISRLIDKVDYAYVAINRYLVTEHTLSIDLPDNIEQSIDCLVKYCHPKFQRLHSFSEVDGNHMVYSHPMDCYGLCK
jgi:hypothetical protein